MTIERLIITGIWVLGAIAVVLFIPAAKRREAAVAFLFALMLSWIVVIISTRLGLLRFPIREFPKAADFPFTPNYLLYPLVTTFCYIYEPKRGVIVRFGYLLLCSLGVGIYHYLIAKYTALMDYVRFAWYIAWIFSFLILFITQLFCKWFFREPLKPRKEKGRTAE